MFLRSLSLIAVLTAFALIQPLAGRARFTSYAEVRDLLTALAEVLPPALKAAHDASSDAAWSSWISNHDRDVRRRLERGDADTIVNWLLFGTSFTARPRALVDAPPSPNDAAQLAELIAGRAADLATAVSSAGQDERRLFARTFFERTGHPFQTPDDRARLEQHLIAEVARVMAEQAGHARELEAVRRLGNASEQFATRSRLFRERGLSLDTSIPPNFALEQALRQMLSGGFVKPASIRRVAVIGPGLDFTDKAAGYDVHPQQTLQPFALADTLLRLGLTDPGTRVQITAFDISPRVHDHLMGARARAQSGAPYVLRLPLELGIGWKPEVIEYWRRLGDRIGVEVRDPKPASAGKTVDIRTIRVRPQIALDVVPEDLDIVAQRFEGPAFDLVAATNVFVYYDTLEQLLAFAAVEAMLRPGGFLLSNNALLELPVLHMRSAGYRTVQYSDRLDDGDHIVWYQRQRQ